MATICVTPRSSLLVITNSNTLSPNARAHGVSAPRDTGIIPHKPHPRARWSKPRQKAVISCAVDGFLCSYREFFEISSRDAQFHPSCVSLEPPLRNHHVDRADRPRLRDAWRPSGMQSERLACLHELCILRPTLDCGAEADTQQPRAASSGASKRGTATL